MDHDRALLIADRTTLADTDKITAKELEEKSEGADLRYAEGFCADDMPSIQLKRALERRAFRKKARLESTEQSQCSARVG